MTQVARLEALGVKHASIVEKPGGFLWLVERRKYRLHALPCDVQPGRRTYVGKGQAAKRARNAVQRGERVRALDRELVSLDAAAECVVGVLQRAMAWGAEDIN